MTAERDEARLLLHARLDGELDAVAALALERTLASDPALRAEAETLAALRGVLRESVPGERAPDALRRALMLKTAPPRPAWRAGWRSIAAAALVSAGLGGGAWLALAPDAETGAFETVIAGHVRALAASRPTDLSSSDRHAIKPWFNGRVAFAPRVFDLTEDGFPLVGGRVDIVDGRPAATLVYRRRQHLISLTANPEPGSGGAPFSGSLRGYSLLGWRDDGVAYRAVSDLGLSEMKTFAELFRARARAP